MDFEEVLIEETYFERRRRGLPQGEKREKGAEVESGAALSGKPVFAGPSSRGDLVENLWDDGFDDDPDDLDELDAPDDLDDLDDIDDIDDLDGFGDDYDGEFDDELDDELDALLADEFKAAARNREIGKRGENAAVRYLEKMGYEILERNWKCQFGEADVIARDGQTLVFVEVKTRTGISKGFPSESVNAKKRRRYEKIAAWYLKEYDEVDIPVRFDVVALLVISEDRAFIRHYVNAFGVES